MCKFLSQAVEQNNIFLIALVHPTRPERGWLFGYFRRYMFCKEAFGPSPISRDGRWCRLGASDKEGKGAAAAEFLPHSARLFCRTASHTRSTQLSQRVTIFNTIVLLYTQYFCHFYSTIWLHAFKYLSGHLISFEGVRISFVFWSREYKRRKGDWKGARDNCDIVTIIITSINIK